MTRALKEHVPAWRRTPQASYITISENPSAIGKSELLRPYWIPTPVVIPMHKEECEDGMPPAREGSMRFDAIAE